MRATTLAVVPALLAVTALALSACGQNKQTIRIDGSSTVFPILEAAAEEYSKITRARVNVGFSGTGGGFEKFCRGETQINDASRPIRDSEVEACAAKGIEDIIELQVAIDALTVVVNRSNDFVDCLTVPQLHDLFAGNATRWSEINPDWPDDDAVFFHPDPDSGTFDHFDETIIKGVDERAAHRGDGTNSADDNVLALGIDGDEDAIGYFGFANFQGAGQSLKAVAIDGGEGCVEPTVENALSGAYAPLSRPLFIYTRESFLEQHPESPVLGFLEFYLINTETLVPEVLYVPMPDELLQEQLDKITPFLQDEPAAGR